MPSRHSGYQSQVEKLDSAVQKMSDLEAYPLWVRLVGVLDTMGHAIDDIIAALRGDGNGEAGILNRMNTVENVIKPMQSDIREIKTMVRILAGFDHDAEPLERPTAENHPGRRSDDQIGIADKIIRWIVVSILPGVIIALIVMYFTFQIAVNNHLISDVINAPVP